MVEPDKDLDFEFNQRQKQKEIILVEPCVNETATTEGTEQKLSIMSSAFATKMDEVKVDVLEQASEEDKKFVETVKDNLKGAAVKSTEVELEKAKYNKQQVQYEEEKLNTAQKRNEQQQLEDKWYNRQKRREYHYNGVKPIMTFVGIKEPLNLVLLYFFTFVLIWFFLINKLLKGTVGVLLAGASDENRTKAAKGFIWTVLGVFTVLVVTAIVYLFLKWQLLI